jgi:hypothetical protein
MGSPSPQALCLNEDTFIKKKNDQIDASPTNFLGGGISPMKNSNLSMAGDRIVTTRRRMLGGLPPTMDMLGTALQAE